MQVLTLEVKEEALTHAKIKTLSHYHAIVFIYSMSHIIVYIYEYLSLNLACVKPLESVGDLIRR